MLQVVKAAVRPRTLAIAVQARKMAAHAAARTAIGAWLGRLGVLEHRWAPALVRCDSVAKLHHHCHQLRPHLQDLPVVSRRPPTAAQHVPGCRERVVRPCQSLALVPCLLEWREALRHPHEKGLHGACTMAHVVKHVVIEACCCVDCIAHVYWAWLPNIGAVSAAAKKDCIRARSFPILEILMLTSVWDPGTIYIYIHIYIYIYISTMGLQADFVVRVESKNLRQPPVNKVLLLANCVLWWLRLIKGSLSPARSLAARYGAPVGGSSCLTAVSFPPLSSNSRPVSPPS